MTIPQSPYLLYSDGKGKIFEDESLYATGRSGWDAVSVPTEEWIELPDGGNLYELPGRRGIGIDVITGDILNEARQFDIVHLDLGLTAEHVRHAHTLLTPGGYLACYTPFFEQMALAIDVAKGLFNEAASYECIMRDMDRSERGTRPSTRVCHSGYITIMRK